MSYSYNSEERLKYHRYVKRQGITCPSFVIGREVEDAFFEYLVNLGASRAPVRSRCLVSFQDHWLALDLEKRTPREPLSIVVLDAANNIHKIGCFVLALDSLLQEICAYELFHFCSTTALQRDGRRCLIFAIEQSDWGHQNPNLHSEVKAIANHEDSLRNCKDYQDIIIQLLRARSNPQHIIDKVISDLKQGHIFLINYDRIVDNISNWETFFLISQSEDIPASLRSSIEPWIIKRGEKRHNLRIEYREHLFLAVIEGQASLTAEAFITNEIEAESKRQAEQAISTNKLPLGVYLQLVIKQKKIHIIKALLQMNQIDLNEIFSGKTAFERVHELADCDEKNEIFNLLQTYAQQRSVSLATIGFSSTSGEQRSEEATTAPPLR